MKRNLSLDILKLLLAIMVIGIHARAFIDIDPMVGFLTGQGLFRIAVPLFFLMNGYYFYDILKQDRVSHWLKRVLVLYVAWMALYSFFWCRMQEVSLVHVVKVALTLVMGQWHSLAHQEIADGPRK